MSAATLDRLQDGESARVQALEGEAAMVRRLRDLGLMEGTCVRCVFRAPCGDPAAYLIRGALIAIRGRDAARITLEGGAP